MKSIKMLTKASSKYLTIRSNIWGYFFRKFYKNALTSIGPIKQNISSPIRKSGIWLVTSVIEPRSKSLSYSLSRSHFSVTERLQQTKESIQSIKGEDPTAEIVLLDGSRVDYSDFFSEYDIHYVHLNNYMSRKFINSPFKGLGEAFMLLSCKDLIAGYSVVNKLSGRYLIHEYDSELVPKIALSSNKAVTIHYTLNSATFDEWLDFLKMHLEDLTHGVSIEDLLTNFTDMLKISNVEKLGVKGLNGITGGFAKF